MQHVANLTPIPAAARKAAALNAYDAALANPTADWQTVAHLLRAALPARREPAVKSGAPRWWADYPLPKRGDVMQQSLHVTFSDGVSMRVNLHTAPGKTPRVAKACRVAIDFYRARIGRDSVPAFAALAVCDGEGHFDVEACSRLTVDLRRSAIVAAPARPAITLERVERMAAEVKRRRAGLARKLACAADPFSTADASAWRAALEAGEAELADMRRACGAASPPPSEGEGGGEPSDSHPDPVAPQAVEVEINTPCPAPVKTHAIIAVCTSHRARETLFRRIQDGCYPDHGRSERHGAYRITLQDAQEIGTIRGVRFVGMPRKHKCSPVQADPAPAAVTVMPSACRALQARLSASVAMHSRAVA